MPMAAVLLDADKAFENAWHTGLLHKVGKLRVLHLTKSSFLDHCLE
jgi:hypothetical protein